MSYLALTESDHWLSLQSPIADLPGTLRLRVPPGGFSEADLRRIHSGDIREPFIIDCGAFRSLFFDPESVQSEMALYDPRALLTAYARKMMSFLLFNPEPEHVLILGLGGGSLAKFCHEHLPQTRISVVEVSAEVIALRQAFDIPADDDRFRIIHGDAADVLMAADLRADVVLIDAFDREGISPSLDSAAFYDRLAATLAPCGIVVMNLSGLKPRYAAHIAHIQERLARPARLVEVEGQDNLLVFAGHGLEAGGDGLRERAGALEARYRLQFQRYLRRITGSSGLTRAR